MSAPVCPACRSEKVEPGMLGSATLWLDSQSFLSKALAGIEVKLLACLDCGHLSLRADPAELRKAAARA